MHRRTIAALACLPVIVGGLVSAAALNSQAAAAGTAGGVYRFGDVGSLGKIQPLERDTPTLVWGISGTVVQVASSNSDGYALTSDGTVWAWGAGAAGELGDGTAPSYVSSAVKVHFPAGVTITSLPDVMPFDGGLAIDSRGDVWGWGINVSHYLCLPAVEVLTPQRLPFSHVSLATGAGLHALFDAGGKVYACGDNKYGELGDGSTASSATPVAVTGLPAGRIKALVSSWQGSGALLSDGSYYDWGFGTSGQLGDGSDSSSPVPVRVRLPGAVTEISQGGSGPGNGQTLAIVAGGSVWVWGSGKSGQLGNGRTASSDVPVRVRFPSGVRITQVYSGGATCYAIAASGTLWDWGINVAGQLGDGSTGSARLTPGPIRLTLTQITATAANVTGYRP
jgi:alpha-tubulin suppressor-like RCC1 family protein